MKLADIKIEEVWAETLTIILILVGFVMALFLSNMKVMYLIVLLSGFLAGRVFYVRRFKEPIFPFVIMIIGFLFGYFLGGFGASRFWIVVLFFGSWGISYYLHLKKFITIFKNKNFIK